MLRRRCCLSLLNTAMFVALAGTLLAQQQVQIDWRTHKPVSPPITVDTTTHIMVVVLAVNDMLYSYSERVEATARPPADIAPAIFGATRTAVAPECKDLDTALTQLDTDFGKSSLKPNASSQDLPESIPLAVTKTAWAAAKQNIAQLDPKTGQCTDQDLLTRKIYYTTTIQSNWDAADRKQHTFTFATTLEALTDYSFFILEQYNGTTTAACISKNDAGKNVGVECQVSYKPASTIITMSGGFLLTELMSPTYDRANVPGSTDAVLTVSNTGSFRAALATLVNVKLPFCASEEWGCAVTAGPVFQLGSTSGASSIGVLVGVSFQLWRYLYITNGFHIGEYPDFPAGFSHAGQPIPAAFTGKLTPINRTTARFAIGLTLKGWTLAKANSTSQGTPTPGAASGTK